MTKRQSPKRPKHPEYVKPERAIVSPVNDRSGPAAVFAALCLTALSTVWLLSIGVQTGGVPPTPRRDPPHVN